MATNIHWIAGVCGVAMLASTPVWAQSDSPFKSMGAQEQVQKAPEQAPAAQGEQAPAAPQQESAPASPFRSMVGSEPAPQPQPLEAEAPKPAEERDQSSSPFQSMEAGTAAPAAQPKPSMAVIEEDTAPETEGMEEPAAPSAEETPPTAAAPENEDQAAVTEPEVPAEDESGWSIGGFLGSIFGPSTDSAPEAETDQAMDAPAIDPASQDTSAEQAAAPAALNVSSDMTQPNMRVYGGTAGENAFLSRASGPRTHIGGWENPDKKSYPAPAQNNTMEDMRRAMQMRGN